MREEIIHFIWKYSYHTFQGLTTATGETVEILTPGIHNTDSGPDFFNAKIKMGNTVWAGNVEIHIKSSDWNKHNHQTNPEYDSVVLHLVIINDCNVYNSKGQQLTTLQIPYPNLLENEFKQLVENKGWIACAHELSNYDLFSLRVWLSNLAVQRLEKKTQRVNELVEQCHGDWEEAFYISLAYSFGLKINALPFELLAKATPLKNLKKVRDNLLSIEALLFGQANLIPFEDAEDDYSKGLAKEYIYQKKKFGLEPIPHHLWKFLRLRPPSFPTIRIAQFAQLLHQTPTLFSKIIEADTPTAFYEMLSVKTSPYWEKHYTFEKESVSKVKRLGKNTIDTIILNSIIPFTFAYGMARNKQELQEKAINMLEEMKPEINSIVSGFKELGVNADSALFTQALVELKNDYCDHKKCLYCQVGTKILLKRLQVAEAKTAYG